MKRLLIFSTCVCVSTGCLSLRHPEHSAYFKLVGDDLCLAVKNEGKRPLTITSVGGHVYLWREDISYGERTIGVAAPGFANGSTHVVEAGHEIDLRVPDDIFEPPTDTGMTVVKMRYTSEAHPYHAKLVLRGTNYIGEELMKLWEERRKKEESLYSPPPSPDDMYTGFYFEWSWNEKPRRVTQFRDGRTIMQLRFHPDGTFGGGYNSGEWSERTAKEFMTWYNEQKSDKDESVASPR